MNSQNFEILRPAWSELATLGGFAEAYAHTDPASALVKLRLFAENFTKDIYRDLGLPKPDQATFVDLLANQSFAAITPRVILDKLHALRIHGNKAAHGESATSKNAIWLLQEAFDLSRWLFVQFGKGDAKAIPAFKQPSVDGCGDIKGQLKREKRQVLERLAAQEAQMEVLLRDLEDARKTAATAEKRAEEIQALASSGAATANLLQFDEATTRVRIIDSLLSGIGWNVAPGQASTAQVGKEVEVLHQPTSTGLGYADYVLWDDNGSPLAVAAMEVVHPRLGREAVVASRATPHPEPRMDIHKNARTTPQSRRLMMQRLASGWTGAAVAEALGVSLKTVHKWRDRFTAEGEGGLADRPSRPHRSPTRLRAPDEAAIIGLRRQRMSGPAIARHLGRPVSTVGVVLRRHGLGRLAALDARPPVRRYQRERPGELVHIDTKKLGRIDGIGHRITGHRVGMTRNRGIGWDHLHVAIDDASRLAYTELLADDRKGSATGFLARALAWFARHGVTVERVMTDNSSAYRSRDFASAIAAAGLRHLRTRPYTPRTNGKAERFIQSSLRDWAYAHPFDSSAARGFAMQSWINTYNHTRPHAALAGKPPITRIASDNLLGNDT